MGHEALRYLVGGAVKIAKHHLNCRLNGCIITERPNPTLHHVHGGSMTEFGVSRGGAQRTSDWLVIPLDADLHVGKNGIDYGVGVLSWERQWGTQLYWLTELCRALGYDVFALAGLKHPGEVPKYPLA